MKTIDTKDVKNSLFIEDVAALTLRLYLEEGGNYTEVQRRLYTEGYQNITYRKLYRFFERQGLQARGLAIPKITINDYETEIVEAYYCVHGNTHRALHFLAQEGINYSKSHIQLLWESKGLRPLGQRVSAEIKRMTLRQIIPYSSYTYTSVSMMLHTFGVNPNSRWESLYHEQMKNSRDSFPVLETSYPFRSKVFTDRDFSDLEDSFDECEGDPHIASEKFNIPSSVVLYHWDDAEKPFDFKYVSAISYKITPKVKQHFSPDELTSLVGGALHEAEMDTTAAWNRLKEEGRSITIHQVLKVARELRRKKK